jgi:hypothetical protein
MQKTSKEMSVYGYKSKETGTDIYTICLNENVPNNSTEKELTTITFTNAKFENPV